jgi:DtxR family transcriptional regulator, manganese transport regulator
MAPVWCVWTLPWRTAAEPLGKPRGTLDPEQTRTNPNKSELALNERQRSRTNPNKKGSQRTDVLQRSVPNPNRFQRTREDHSREKAEDYVELIDTLIREKGEARAVDLAERFGISHVSVGKTVRRLQREGYVTAEPYRSIFLTEAGAKLASEARERHELVRDFLLALGVREEVAEVDAEGIEHHVSEETLEAMRRHLARAGGR